MQRSLLFLLLVVAVPGGVYWASHGFEPPGRAMRRFGGEFADLRPVFPEPEPEAEPEPEPDAEPREPETAPPESPPEAPTEPEQPEAPRPPAETPKAKAERLFAAGRFDEAAEAYALFDADRRDLARLGSALAKATPVRVPDHEIARVELNTGEKFVAFVEEGDGLVTLHHPGGRTEALPASAIEKKSVYPREKGLDRLAAELTRRAEARDVTGAQLFAILQAALTLDRPEVAAPYLPLLFALDEEKPFLLSAVRRRIAPEHRDAVYVALAACQAPEAEEPEGDLSVARTPRSLNGERPKKRNPRPMRSSVTNPDALAYMSKASPLRREGETIYRKIASGTLADSQVPDIEKAIELFDRAAELYEKALEIQDADEIATLLVSCSRRRFKLAFWKQQAQGR